ncbi:hypothetical protein GF327_07160 [Candidatus Woesearchaeota archaeon]|nr:hypothetical protein [Candidatus Woesearchaeota archaeon]
MKIAAFLDSPLKEAFLTAGIEFVFPAANYKKNIKKVNDNIKLIIVEDKIKREITKKYPDKIIIGV